MDTSKRTKELPMTLPELKIAVYLLPEVAWPIIKQNVANTGNRLQCFEVTSDALGQFRAFFGVFSQKTAGLLYLWRTVI